MTKKNLVICLTMHWLKLLDDENIPSNIHYVYNYHIMQDDKKVVDR